MHSASPGDPDISVIIVSYETRDCTLACVQSVKDHDGQFGIEIIVVDNASKDGTADALRAAHPDIITIASPVNGGFAHANQQALAVAKGKRVVLLNPDAELYPESLPAAMQALDADPRLGVVGAQVLLPDGTRQYAMMRFPSLRGLAVNVFLTVWLTRRYPWLGDGRYASLDPERPHKVDAVAGCFMAVRREVVDGVGGLDPRFFVYGEEVEWCRRIRNAGWDIAYRPEVRILHQGGAATSHMTVWKAREMMRGQLLYFALAEGRWKARGAALIMVLRDLVRLPVALVLAPFGGRERLRAVTARLALGLPAIFSPPRGQSLPPIPGAPEPVRR